MRRVVAIAILAICLPAQHVSVRGPEPAVVRPGETAVVTLRVDGADNAELGALATIDGLRLTAGSPVAARAQALVDGALVPQASLAWPIRITAERAGSFELPSFAVTVRGATSTSAPARLEVLPADAGDDTLARGSAFVELSATRTTCFLHEPIELRLRFGFEQTFRRDHLVPMFARAIDVPAQVRASFWASLPHAVAGGVRAPAAGARRASFALDEAIATATQGDDVVREGRSFTVFEIARTFLPTHTGELVVPGPALRFAYATRFADDFVDGRVAVDRREGCVHGAPLRVQVEAWPEEGRPAEFTGAVGTFTLQAAATPSDVAVGDSVKLTLRIAGEGNLALFGAPRLAATADFHVLGKVEEKNASERVVTYDLSPRRADAVLPRIAFAFFDPTPPGSYRTVESAAVALRVRPGATGPPLPAAAVRVAGENDIYDLASTKVARGDGRRLPSSVVGSALAAPWLLAALLVTWQRRRDRAQNDPLGTRARRAAAAFRARAAASDADATAAFVEFLAARARCTEAAILSPDLRERLGRAGIAPDLAARAASVVEHRSAGRYGGIAPAEDRIDVPALVRELEAAFARAPIESAKVPTAKPQGDGRSR